MARPSQQTARRLSLLAAAQRAVAQKGVTKLRLKDVADAAGVTPASVLYYYGEGIEALLVALYRQSIARYAER
ncbi:MAG TPA: TetR family transcriptional regulator, partial [Streptosporangiaceae bacterium]